MCTVVYIPSDNSLFFASLRDESPTRPAAIEPQLYVTETTTILSPKDALAGGTWLGINNYRNVIVLLNGGFVKHEQKNNYRQSRGLIVSELLKSELPVVDWELMDLFNIEPFTLVIWSEQMLFQLVWDGNKKHRIKLDATTPQIFSSATLYQPEVHELRKTQFLNWLPNHATISSVSLLNFFKSKYDQEEGFIINRDEKVITLSYTFIEVRKNDVAEVNYFDLRNNTNQSNSIVMSHSPNNCPLSL